MADEVKIPVSVPGAKQAAQDLRGVADAEHKVGTAGSEGGKKAADGMREADSAASELGSRLGINTRVFASWKTAAVAAAAAVAGAIAKTIARIQEVNEGLKLAAQQAAMETGTAGTRALANVRGQSQSQTLLSTYQQATQFDVTRETAETASFAIESGIQASDVGGTAGILAIESAALETAAISGAGGGTVGGLALTAREAMGASRPEEFKQFFAKSLAYAKSSRVSLEELGGILNETLPLAVKAGIDPDKFMAMAAAMSFRIKQPQMVRTALRQMIAATTRPSAGLSSLASKAGQDLSAMSAAEIMDVQSSLLEQAALKGPQEIGKVVEALGLPVEIGQVYMQTTDAASKLRQGQLLAAGRSATYESTIATDFSRLMHDPLSRYRRAQISKQMETIKRGMGVAGLEAATTEAEAFIESQAAAGNTEAQLAEILGLTEGKARSITLQETRTRLEYVASTPAFPAGIRARAKKALDAIGEERGLWGASPTEMLYQYTGVGLVNALGDAQTVLSDADLYVDSFRPAARASLVPSTSAVYNGGTHYHMNDREDPAGVPREPAGSGY